MPETPHLAEAIEGLFSARDCFWFVTYPAAVAGLTAPQAASSPGVGFDAAIAKATIYGSGDQPISWISRFDVAQFAVESVTNPAARNAVLELGDPEPVSPHQVIKLFEEASGKTFEVSHVPAKALKAQMEGATDPMEKTFVGLMYCYAVGDPIDIKTTLNAFPLKLTSVQDYVKETLA